MPVIKLIGAWKIWKQYQISNFQVNFSDCWLKYFLWNCLHEMAFRLMSLELTENKSNIGSGALNDLVFILYCRVIGQWLPTRRRSVGNQLGSNRQPIGDGSATIFWAFVYDCRKSATDATSRQPVGDHHKPFYDRFGRREVSLAATKTSLRPNRPCNLLQPVGDQSPTSLQPQQWVKSNRMNYKQSRPNNIVNFVFPLHTR